MTKYDKEWRKRYNQKRRKLKHKRCAEAYKELTCEEQIIEGHKIQPVFSWNGQRSRPKICPHCFKWFQPPVGQHRLIYCEKTIECIKAQAEWRTNKQRIASRESQRRTSLLRKSIYKKRGEERKGPKRLCQGKARLRGKWDTYKCVKVIPDDSENWIFCPACHDIAGTIENHM